MYKDNHGQDCQEEGMSRNDCLCLVLSKGSTSKDNLEMLPGEGTDPALCSLQSPVPAFTVSLSTVCEASRLESKSAPRDTNHLMEALGPASCASNRPPRALLIAASSSDD